MLDFLALAQQCAPTVAPQTMAAVVHVESRFNPFAIGVVGGRLARQPANIEEAVATAKALEAGGWNFSVGVGQVNRYNLPKYELTYEKAFEPCANLRAASKILEDCFVRARPGLADEQAALQAAISCYYSGNFTRGFRPDKAGEPSYVQKVLAQANVTAPAIPVVPSIKGGTATPPKVVKAAPAATDATAAPAAVQPPPDHAPVLLRRSRGEDAVQLRPVVTDESRSRDLPVSNGNASAEGQPKAANGDAAARRAVIF
ncbi:TPA: lytic transglycosylase domain-containing protein [Pseudomonas aeruginosa]